MKILLLMFSFFYSSTYAQNESLGIDRKESARQGKLVYRSPDCLATSAEWEEKYALILEKITLSESKQEIDLEDFFIFSKRIVYCAEQSKQALSHFQACLNPLIAFTAQRQKEGPFTLGAKITNADYAATHQEKIKLPEEIKDPLLNQYIIERKVKEAVERVRELFKNRQGQNRVRVVAYESEHIPAADNKRSFKRLLVVIPGKPRDQWVQFAISEPGGITEQVSMISVEPEKEGSQIFFEDHVRNSDQKDLLWSKRPNIERCLKCHGGGVRAVYPGSFLEVNDKKMSAEFKNDLEEVNSMVANYPAANWSKSWDESGFGPPVGPTVKRESDFLNFCTQYGRKEKLTVEQKNKVGAAMNCTTCHDNQYRNFLQPDMLISNQIFYHIFATHEGRMPKDDTLDKDEQMALFQCLKLEYFGAENSPQKGLFTAWLTENCPQTLKRRLFGVDRGGSEPSSLGAEALRK